MKVLIVTTTGANGMVLTVAERVKRDFGDIDIVCQWLPRVETWLLALLAVRWPKHRWWRRWMRLREKVPYAFKRRTRRVARQVASRLDDCDFVMMFGALHDLGVETDKPVFALCDSTRALSMRNEFDEACHFDSERQRREWLSLEAGVYRRATKIFVGAERVAHSLRMDYGIADDKVVVTGFGANFDANAALGKDFSQKHVLFVGKGDFIKKGGEDLLKAFRIVRETCPDAVLHVVGQDKVKSRPRDNIISYGFVSDKAKLNGLMAQASVFVLPSYVDRNPISVIEAMSTGTACIVSGYGAMPEMVGDTGLVVPCGDDEALATSMLKFLEDPAYARQMGERARLFYIRHYTWDRIWERMRGEIERALQMWRQKNGAG